MDQGLPDWDPKIQIKSNEGNYPEMNPDTRQKLMINLAVP